MRRTLLLSLAGLVLAAPASFAQGPQPPHAWLFGTWTGGIFPVSSTPSPEACFSQPVVIFTRDLVMRATLTNQTLTQRVVETARVTAQGVEFHFAVPAGATPSLLGETAPDVGFGCPSPDSLYVQRINENAISFPGCADFPNPLVRCQTATERPASHR